MPDESFDVALRDALSRVPSSTGDNLMGFQIDMEAYMEDSVVPFRDVVVRRTGDPTKLLVATCTCEHLEAAIIKDALSHVWQEQLRYNFWEQHEFVSNDREVRLRFVTTTGRNEGLCVTGEIVVTIDS